MKLTDLVDLYPTGSREICNPPPTNTDEDYLCVVRKRWHLSRVVQLLKDEGFTCSVGEDYAKLRDFTSWRKGEINYVLTANQDFALKYRVATALAKRLNLLNKSDRIATFHAVIHAEFPDSHTF